MTKALNGIRGTDTLDGLIGSNLRGERCCVYRSVDGCQETRVVGRDQMIPSSNHFTIMAHEDLIEIPFDGTFMTFIVWNILSTVMKENSEAGVQFTLPTMVESTLIWISGGCPDFKSGTNIRLFIRSRTLSKVSSRAERFIQHSAMRRRRSGYVMRCSRVLRKMLGREFNFELR